jgi:hypothetical protein
VEKVGLSCAGVFSEFDKEGSGVMATAHLEAALERLGQDPAAGAWVCWRCMGVGEASEGAQSGW